VHGPFHYLADAAAGSLMAGVAGLMARVFGGRGIQWM